MSRAIASYVGHNETLPCILIADLEAQNITVSAEDITWQLPDGRTLNENTTELDNKKIVDSGDLLITEIKKEDFAWYLCIVINDTETLYSKALLKKVLTSDELHDQQMTQVTIGSIAAAVVIAIFGSLCIIYVVYPTETSPHTDEADRKRSGYAKNRVADVDNTKGEVNLAYDDTEVVTKF
ncbi:PREDICTED: uncharacterized protein LOC106805853 [Priapulus caudatus]|uniref:Uncharacterized protein LOC106805853 n=1 Tax=Priapulus caudatus TaxID=37621 RepID=A0ABM1DT40_PRICU|nr:PREDICTED: uncharacterized protein LOC106805853 [Priapulus caudatus]